MTDYQDLPMEEYRRAGLEITRGNPEVYKSLWSRRDDVTLANPFGPPVRGWEDVSARLTSSGTPASRAKLLVEAHQLQPVADCHLHERSVRPNDVDLPFIAISQRPPGGRAGDLQPCGSVPAGCLLKRLAPPLPERRPRPC